MMIPRRKSLPIESLKQILSCLSYLQQTTPIFDWTNPGTEQKINYLFKNYTDKDITELFTRGTSSEDFLRLYNNLYQIQELPVLKTFNQLSMLFVDKPLINKQLIELKKHQLSNGAKFHFLLNYEDYKKASVEFSNCVHSYFDKSCDIITCYLGQDPLACISILKDGKIGEIAGYKNSPVSDKLEQEIKDLVLTLSSLKAA